MQIDTRFMHKNENCDKPHQAVTSQKWLNKWVQSFSKPSEAKLLYRNEWGMNLSEKGLQKDPVMDEVTGMYGEGSKSMEFTE